MSCYRRQRDVSDALALPYGSSRMNGDSPARARTLQPTSLTRQHFNSGYASSFQKPRFVVRTNIAKNLALAPGLKDFRALAVDIICSVSALGFEK
ncbi:hypothetical protein Tcan_14934 [Toxocara canis]|uniref:Uncharacterized protein n=1 Tax=Toxocara canis TaxID=6265 RepID=A0A0B2V574_TOXCA|nr:hypothetical protein Tcan_14934 [Toxocara canis]